MIEWLLFLGAISVSVGGAAILAWANGKRSISPSAAPPFERASLPSSGDALQDDITNGAEAAKLLQNELLRWSVTEMRSRIIEEFTACSLQDTDRMLTLKLWLKVLEGFEQNLASLISAGKLASAELSRIDEQREFEKKYGKLPI